MPRPKRCRRICNEPKFKLFTTEDAVDTILLSVDEYETIRLIDLENKTQEECSIQMQVARTTVTDIYFNARKKIADCIVNGKKLVIQGGNYQICDRKADCFCSSKCENKLKIIQKGVNFMRIAVTYESGQIFGHFGHTQQFKFYDVENGKIVSTNVIDTNGSGHGALAGLLQANKVDVLICGGIGGGAQMALSEAGIKLFGGVSGSADQAVNSFLENNLNYNPNVKCSHHDHEHGDSAHTCGEHGCGKHDCGNH